MTTAVFEVACSISTRIDELERLTSLAEREFNSNVDNYGSLCRACCLLLASHLEGFLKDLTRSLTVDLNFYLDSFAKMPPALQRSFCQKIAFFDGVPQDEMNQRIKQLTAFFNENSVTIDLGAFTYKESRNKNPSSDVVESMLERIGVPAVLHSIMGTRLEAVFAGDVALSYLVRRDIRRFRARLFNFPYRRLPELYSFNHKAKRGGKGTGGASIWHTYVDEVMHRRHRIAHGDTMVNEATISELRQDIEKMEVLMHAIMYSAVAYVGKSHGPFASTMNARCI